MLFQVFGVDHGSVGVAAERIPRRSPKTHVLGPALYQALAAYYLASCNPDLFKYKRSWTAWSQDGSGSSHENVL